LIANTESKKQKRKEKNEYQKGKEGERGIVLKYTITKLSFMVSCANFLLSFVTKL